MFKHLKWLKYLVKYKFENAHFFQVHTLIQTPNQSPTQRSPHPSILVTPGELRLDRAERFRSFPLGEGRAELVFLFFTTLGCC